MLPARLMLDVARSLPGADATLELRPAEQDVEVVSGAATFHIRTLRAEDFPPLPEPGGENVVEVPAAAFVETINRVARSASRDETRPILTGILVSADGRRAADGRDRLLPPERQGDEARGAAGAAASRPTCRPARCRSSRGIAQRPSADDADRVACAPTRSSSRSAATSSRRA